MSALWQTPVVVLAILGWLSAPPKTLGEAAQREAIRRQIVGKPKAALTNIGQPAEIPLVPPAAPPAGDEQGAAASGDKTSDKAGADKASPEKVKDEKYWRERVATANDRLKRDQMMGEALQTRANSLRRDSVNMDDQTKQRQAREALQSTLDEITRNQKQIEEDRKAIQEIEVDARKAGVPAGWIR